MASLFPLNNNYYINNFTKILYKIIYILKSSKVKMYVEFIYKNKTYKFSEYDLINKICFIFLVVEIKLYGRKNSKEKYK